MMKKQKKTKQRFYKLDRIYTPYTKGNKQTTNTLFDVDSQGDVLLGSRAEYVQYEPLRAKKQWKGGFMFSVEQADGKVQEVTYNEIAKERKEAKRKSKSKKYTIPSIDNYGENVYAPANPQPRESGTKITDTNITNAYANSDGIKYTDKSGDSVGDTSNNSVENIKEKNLVPPKDKVVKADMFSKVEGEEANIKKDELQPKGGDQKLDYAELEEWWYETEVKKVKKAAQGMNLTGATLKDFINAFDKAKEFTTLQRFIERIKDCY